MGGGGGAWARASWIAPTATNAAPRKSAQSNAFIAILSGPVVLIVFALAAHAQLGSERRARGIQFRVHVERGLIGPALQEHQPVGVRGAPEDLELLAAGLFHRLGAAGDVGLRQLGAFPR